MDNIDKVLNIFKNASEPLTQKEIALKANLDLKEVDKIFKQLKKTEKIISKIRCKWEINT